MKRFVGLASIMVSVCCLLPVIVTAGTDEICSSKNNAIPAVYRSSGGKTLSACFDNKQGRVSLVLPDGRKITLPVAVSGSGARYSNEKETFWEHQGVGRFFVGETLVFEGTLKDLE